MLQKIDFRIWLDRIWLLILRGRLYRTSAIDRGPLQYHRLGHNRTIRLVRFFKKHSRGKNGEMVPMMAIQHYSLDDKRLPPYVILSYAPGDKTSNVLIKDIGFLRPPQEVAVSTNLVEALNAILLSYRYYTARETAMVIRVTHDIRVWNDHLCINEKDDVEKSQQTKMVVCSPRESEQKASNNGHT